MNFSGEYRVRCVADEHAVAVGLSDKPCWEITGPDGLHGIVWSWWREPKTILREFFKSLDVIVWADEPVAFSIQATARNTE
jgi:hypothetical protein